MFQAHVNIEDLDSLEDLEHCVIYYNQAVLLYHLKQYSTALKIMHKIFSFIEPMGKKFETLYWLERRAIDEVPMYAAGDKGLVSSVFCNV
jgi:hypothetical protein